MISHIELRSEESIDVRQYVHQRRVEKVVVSLDGEIKEIRSAFLKVMLWQHQLFCFIFLFVQILSRVVNRLIDCRVLYAIDVEKLSRYQLLQARDKFRSNPELQVTMVIPIYIQAKCLLVSRAKFQLEMLKEIFSLVSVCIMLLNYYKFMACVHFTRP